MRGAIAAIPFRRPAPDNWSISDRGVHDACMAWAITCVQHDWQRPGTPHIVDEDEAIDRRHIKVTRPNGKVVHYIDEEDPSVLCRTGKQLYNRWGAEIFRRILKVGD
jgi:hypothetical protein